MTDIDPTLAWILRVSPTDHATFSLGDRPIRNHFLKGIVSEDARVAAHVTIKPAHKGQSLEWVSQTYQLPDFNSALSLCLSHLGFQTFPPNDLNVWNAFRLQLLSSFHGFKIMPSQQLQALAPSTEFPLGKCDTVLLYPSSQDEIPTVAQVRVIFCFSETKKNPLPVPLKEPFLYVQFFEVFGDPDDTTKMYKLRRRQRLGSDGQSHRVGGVIPITAVTHAVELIPIYGRRHNHEATANISLEVYNEFYLNNYSDKEWYHTVSEEYL
ncbi:hypothetical protein JVU11DRAFT_2289 [Chiua virens]|nr:hypothetical protein JVU11DRAFT_2289 [Chiua virens]